MTLGALVQQLDLHLQQPEPALVQRQSLALAATVQVPGTLDQPQALRLGQQTPARFLRWQGLQRPAAQCWLQVATTASAQLAVPAPLPAPALLAAPARQAEVRPALGKSQVRLAHGQARLLCWQMKTARALLAALPPH